MGDIATLGGVPGARTQLALDCRDLPILAVLALYEEDMLKRGLNTEAAHMVAARLTVEAAAKLLARYIAIFGPLPPTDDDCA